MSLLCTERYHERDGIWENNTPAGVTLNVTKQLLSPGSGQRTSTQNISFRIRNSAGSGSTVRNAEFRIESPPGTIIFRMGAVSPVAGGFRGGKFQFPGGISSPTAQHTNYIVATIGETLPGVTTFNMQAKAVYEVFEA